MNDVIYYSNNIHSFIYLLSFYLYTEPWLLAEDNQLRELIEQHGTGNWTNIAEFLPGRSGKQCRERWHNHLNPGIKKVCIPSYIP